MRHLVVTVLAVLTLVGCGTSSAHEGVPVIPAVPDIPPASINIPKIHAASTLIPLGLNPDGSLATPDVKTPLQAAYYSLGVLPGKIGPAIVEGHIDGSSPDGKAGYPGIFAHLKDLTIGDEIDITESNNVVLKFYVYRIMQMPKNAFDTATVYRNTATPEIRAITCQGAFDPKAHSYRDNLVVFARE